MVLALPRLLFVVFVGGTAFWIWMLIDCTMNYPKGSDKLVWILILIST